MSMDATLRQIIEAGTKAPSGDNSQPWSFAVKGDTIELSMHPERDHALLNVRSGGTLLACGAALENMALAARAAGMSSTLSLGMPGEGPVACLTVRPGPTPETEEAALASVIPDRHTNRTPYKTDPLPDAFLAASRSLVGYEPCRVVVLSDARDVHACAGAASTMEEIALTTERLHELFFGSLLFAREPHEAGEPGLHLSTMELPAPARLLFRLLRSWPLVRFLNRMGFARQAAAGNAAVYASSGAMIVFLVPDRTPGSMIAAGRATERLWLTAVRQGLAAQPLAGLIYIAASLREGAADIYDEAKRSRIREAEDILRDASGATEGEELAMMLRVGVPQRPPTDFSRRKAPVISLT